jgi:hypothetical protein
VQKSTGVLMPAVRRTAYILRSEGDVPPVSAPSSSLASPPNAPSPDIKISDFFEFSPGQATLIIGYQTQRISMRWLLILTFTLTKHFPNAHYEVTRSVFL